MITMVERLRFDATRCEMHFSKGVAGNISEAADEIERLRSQLINQDEHFKKMEAVGMRMEAALRKIAAEALDQVAVNLAIDALSKSDD